jgi:hypothetical protein
MMEVRTARGIAYSKYPLAIFETKRNLALVPTNFSTSGGKPG